VCSSDLQAGVKEQGFIVHDEVLVERQPACAWDPHRRIDPMNPISDLMHIRPRLRIRDGHRRLLSMNVTAETFGYLSLDYAELAAS
jgi:hypothetical protein